MAAPHLVPIPRPPVNISGINSSAPYDACVESPFPFYLLLCYCLAMTLGNFLIVIVVYRKQHLQLTRNFFIVSFAIAGCFVSGVVMISWMMSYVRHRYWPFGPLGCDTWRFLDVFASNGSIFSLCMILLDRYIAITDTSCYTLRMRPMVGNITLFGVWLLTLVLFSPISFWSVLTEKKMDLFHCRFGKPIGFVVFSLMSFGGMVVLATVYRKVYRAITEKQRRFRMVVFRANQQRVRDTFLNKLNRESRDSKILGIFVAVFILCWFPFLIMNIVVAVCGNYCFNDSEYVLAVVTWLRWVNTSLNPIFYAFCVKDLKKALIKLLFPF